MQLCSHILKMSQSKIPAGIRLALHCLTATSSSLINKTHSATPVKEEGITITVGTPENSCTLMSGVTQSHTKHAGTFVTFPLVVSFIELYQCIMYYLLGQWQLHKKRPQRKK